VSAFAELILALIDLVKINLEQSKDSLFSFFIALALLFSAALFLVGGIGLLLAGLHMGLTRVMPTFGASLITGGVTLLLGGILFWIGKARVEK